MANNRSSSESDDDDGIATDSSGNYDILKDCLSTMIIEKLSPTDTRPSKKRNSKGRKNAIKPVERPAPTEAEMESDVAELGDFTEVSLSGDEVGGMLGFWERIGIAAD